MEKSILLSRANVVLNQVSTTEVEVRFHKNVFGNVLVDVISDLRKQNYFEKINQDLNVSIHEEEDIFEGCMVYVITGDELHLLTDENEYTLFHYEEDEIIEEEELDVTQDEALKYLREEYGYHISVIMGVDGWAYYIYDLVEEEVISIFGPYESIEDANAAAFVDVLGTLEANYVK